MRTFGADVSHWESDIDWIKGVDYLPFVYYKATDGEYWIDVQFGNNMDECNEVGMPHAPYHWWQEKQDPIIQAEHFWDTVQDGGYKQLIVDVEPREIYGNMYGRLMQHLGRIEQLSGIIPSIYTSKNYWDNYIKVNYPTRHPLLVAQYAYRSNPILPMGATSWKIWQFTDQFWFSGCNATADGNWFNGDLTACRNWFGNYHPYNAPPPISGVLKMESLYEGLRIRELPSTNSRIVGTLHLGEEVDVDDVGGWNAWVHHSRGWSNAHLSGTQNMKVI
jgi:lysozyme